MQSANEIIEAIHNLPSGEQEKIRKLLEEEKLAKRREMDERIARFKQAEKWLAANRAAYLGQWVCLYGDKLIAHGADALAVHQTAKDAGIASPFVVRVVEEPKAFAGTWS